MGAFNILRMALTCPSCKRETWMAIQFELGDTFQHEYALGDQGRT